MSSISTSSANTPLDAVPADRPVIVWFRDDLRLADNPALTFAATTGRPVLPIFVHDTVDPAIRPIGGASRWWLSHSLEALDASLTALDSGLNIFKGSADDIVIALARATNAASIVWNRRYGAAEQAQDARIKAMLKGDGRHAQSFNSHLLREPWEVKGKSGGPMKVFTPYWRASRALGEPALPAPAPVLLASFNLSDTGVPKRASIADLKLRPTKPDWSVEMATQWKPGETGARAALGQFLDFAAKGYGENRNRPDQRSTSRLSPHLRFGEIGPRQIWHATQAAFAAGHTPAAGYDIDKFLTEIGWREFSYHLLNQFPALATRNFQSRFDAFPWANAGTAAHPSETLKAWQRGQTGYPIVDAGMRELWRTGWMHNRVRMIVGSFLVKHLLIDWRIGEDWFWDTLVDADPASNAASWQWVAGSGADAAPYFRIFAPVLQGEKFDPRGDYVRTYVPELAKLPKAFIHKPWTAPHPVLATAGITLGMTYPHPIVVHEKARERALAAFKSLGASGGEELGSI